MVHSRARPARQYLPNYQLFESMTAHTIVQRLVFLSAVSLLTTDKFRDSIATTLKSTSFRAAKGPCYTPSDQNPKFFANNRSWRCRGMLLLAAFQLSHDLWALRYCVFYRCYIHSLCNILRDRGKCCHVGKMFRDKEGQMLIERLVLRKATSYVESGNGSFWTARSLSKEWCSGIRLCPANCRGTMELLEPREK